MMTRRKSIVGSVVVAGLLLPSSIAIAAGALPQSWKPYAWIAVLAALLLTAYLVVDARRARSVAPDSQPSDREQPTPRRVYPRVRASMKSFEAALMRMYGWLSNHGDAAKRGTTQILESQGAPSFNMLVTELHAALCEVEQDVDDLCESAHVPRTVQKQAARLDQRARELHRQCADGSVVHVDTRMSWFESANKWRTQYSRLQELMEEEPSTA